MSIFINPGKTADDFTTLSKDYIGQTVIIEWLECWAKYSDESVVIYGLADKLKGAINFSDKTYEFKKGLLMISMPLKPFTYKEKTVNVAEITKLMKRFIDDGLMGTTKAFVGTLRLDDTAEQFIDKLLTETSSEPLDPIKKECFVEAFLDGKLIDCEDKFSSKLPAQSGYSKGNYKRVSLADKNKEFLALLQEQLPSVYSKETYPELTLEMVYTVIGSDPAFLAFVTAIMGMV